MRQNKKTENPLLKECFFTALIRLMDQKDFKDITISEIAQKAGVSRMTYYRTYSSKEDILLQYFDDQAENLIQMVKDQPDMTDKQFFTILFHSFQDHGYFMKYLYQAGLISNILNHFTEFIHLLYTESGKISCTDSDIQYPISFMAGGLYMLLLRWIESGQKETPEEMAQISLDILSGHAYTRHL